MMETKSRYVYIDYIKTIGLFLVILAHLRAPDYLQQFRSFDVPLLVFTSGYLARKAFRSGKVRDYYYKRFLRLIVPTWCFLGVFFLATSLFFQPPKMADIIKGLLLQRDANMIGMVWVIWVYYLCALLIPFIKKIGYSRIVIYVLLFLFIGYEILCMFTSVEENRLIYCTFLTAVPWGVITYFGFYYDELSRLQKEVIASASTLVFIVYSFVLKYYTGKFVLTSEFKYPARLYYLSFAFPIVLLLFEYGRTLPLKANRIITFFSSSSLWVYLWHILFLYIVKLIIVDDSYWFFQYCLIIIMSSLITLLQRIVIRFFLNKHEIPFLKIFLG